MLKKISFEFEITFKFAIKQTIFVFKKMVINQFK